MTSFAPLPMPQLRFFFFILIHFAKGACPKSHGMHVARLAGLESSVVDVSAEKVNQIIKLKIKFKQIILKFYKMQIDKKEQQD